MARRYTSKYLSQRNPLSSLRRWSRAYLNLKRRGCAVFHSGTSTGLSSFDEDGGGPKVFRKYGLRWSLILAAKSDPRWWKTRVAKWDWSIVRAICELTLVGLLGCVNIFSLLIWKFYALQKIRVYELLATTRSFGELRSYFMLVRRSYMLVIRV